MSFLQSCGTVNRVTIPGNKDKHPKGYAYVEFLELEAVENALKLDGSEIAGRNIKVNQKRTNEAGVSRGRGRGRTMRGRGGRGRGAWPMMPMMPMPYAPFDPFMCAPTTRYAIIAMYVMPVCSITVDLP